MINSDFVTVTDLLDDSLANISFKSDPYLMCAFYTALGESSQK